MNNNFTQKNCLLCASKARSKKTDSGNSEIYLCTNQECGDIEITLSVRRKIENNIELKKQLMKAAKKARSEGFVLFLSTDNKNQIQQQYITKR